MASTKENAYPFDITQIDPDAGWVQLRVEVRLLKTTRVLVRKKNLNSIINPGSYRVRTGAKKAPRNTAISEGGERYLHFVQVLTYLAITASQII